MMSQSIVSGAKLNLKQVFIHLKKNLFVRLYAFYWFYKIIHIQKVTRPIVTNISVNVNNTKIHCLTVNKLELLFVLITQKLAT